MVFNIIQGELIFDSAAWCLYGDYLCKDKWMCRLANYAKYKECIWNMCVVTGGNKVCMKQDDNDVLWYSTVYTF
jgi:hypothetical protein